MVKPVCANGFFYGNSIYDQLLRRRLHFLPNLSRAVDVVCVQAALKYL